MLLKVLDLLLDHRETALGSISIADDLSNEVLDTRLNPSQIVSLLREDLILLVESPSDFGVH